MASRPSLLDLRSDTAQSNLSTVSKPLRSPRLHVAGEIPPELSPLDAFAMQSRLLARQLQESAKEGNRMSRLPPLTVESPLIVQGRSDYFRSLSQDSGSEAGDHPPLRPPSGFGMRTEVEDAFSDEAERPVSMHPRMSRIPPTPDEDIPAVPPRAPSRGRVLDHIDETNSFFGARRERSPSSLHSDTLSQSDRRIESSPSRKDDAASLLSARRPSGSISGSITGSPDKPKMHSFDELGLAPPQNLFPQRRRTPSNVSSPAMITDEDGSGNMGGSFHSLPPRKLSSASAMASPGMGSYRRSPSIGSESSALPRPSFNFSRPMSRSGTPGMEPPLRQASSDSQPSFILADESAHTPVSMHSEAFLEQHAEDRDKGAPSYIYSKFTLPRGKAIQRGESDENTEAPFDWEQPIVPPSDVHQSENAPPPSPPTRPTSSSAQTVPDESLASDGPVPKASVELRQVQSETVSPPMPELPPAQDEPSVEESRHSEDVPRGRGRGRTPASIDTSDTASTIRPPPTARSTAPTASEMTAEQHLAKGIECHENGDLKESTYHLRYAARLNDPTAMLLYALACRHGWGMRANQKEGVEWLRKAAEYASVEIADDESHAKEGKHVDVVERRTRKAQFALSIYELG
ncbi:DSF2 Suppressor of mptFive pufFive mutation, partial [Fusarium heterosporum]